MSIFSFDSLRKFVKEIFISLGAADSDADTAAEVLLSADLRGVESHGIARLSGYIRLCESGRINFSEKPAIIYETPSTATIDAKMGSGLIVSVYAMQIAIEKAKQVGTGWVSVCNSSHFGIAGYHAMLALEHDMIGIAMTNASALVAPTFSKERMLGTNPMCYAIPGGEEPSIVADFATTTASNGKLEILQRKNENTPGGWVQDIDGMPSTDAHALKNGGSLLPLGSDREGGSHKGFMLGSVVDIFSAILSGANYGPWVPPFPAYVPMPENMPGKGIGHFFGAMRVDSFRPLAEYQKNIDQWIRRFRSAKPAGNQNLIIPGDPERIMEAKRRVEGIRIDNELVSELLSVAEKFSLHFPKPM